MKLVSGVDLIEVARVEAAIQRHGARFLERVYTPGELADCAGRSTSLAARFAAKEAAAKALGCGIGTVAWKEIEVRRGPAGQPELLLHGNAAQRSAEMGIESWSISLTHTSQQALAMVVGVSA